ncbi:porin [Plesiomonas shigelloides]|uniref:porin n=1 Tax=Plesiomonas shigelloides TaxID=703 RepID=UPI00057A0017|nr:porin [Plesiomonas shigelloides]
MKKTILALAVPALLAAGVTNAATVYSNDGTTIDLKGSIRLKMEKADSKDVDLKDDSSRIGLGIKHDLGNGLSALGYYEMGYDTQKQGSSQITNRLGYAGFSMNDIGTLTFGRVTAPFDDVAVSDYSYIYGGVMDFGRMEDASTGNGILDKNNFLARVSNTMKVESAQYNGFSAAASYSFGTNDDKETAGNLDNAYTLAAFYESDFGLTFNAGYGHGKSTGSVNVASQDLDIWGLGAQYQIADFSFALDYGQAKLDSNIAGQDKYKADLLGLGAKYQVIPQSSLYAGYYLRDYKDQLVDNADKNEVYVAGVDYQFTKNVVTFIEYAYDKTSYANNQASEADNKGSLGLRVYF